MHTGGSHTGPSGVKNNIATFVFIYVRNEKIFTKKLRDSIINSGNFDKFKNICSEQCLWKYSVCNTVYIQRICSVPHRAVLLLVYCTPRPYCLFRNQTRLLLYFPALPHPLPPSCQHLSNELILVIILPPSKQYNSASASQYNSASASQHKSASANQHRKASASQHRRDSTSQHRSASASQHRRASASQQRSASASPYDSASVITHRSASASQSERAQTQIIIRVLPSVDTTLFFLINALMLPRNPQECFSQSTQECFSQKTQEFQV